jgi:hypothetical protein
MSQQLIKYEAACRALSECKSVDEVKAWSDKAAAMQAYGRMAKDKTLEVDAAEIRIRAERRLGEMLVEQKADGGLNKGKLKQGPALVCDEGGKQAAKLADAGISYDLSSRAQKLAAVPEAEFEAEVGEWRDRVKAEGERVTARLQKAGERQINKSDHLPEELPDDGPDLSELVDELQAENTRLLADIKAMEADDLKAEAVKWRRSYDHAVRQQSEAMDKAKKSQDREKWTMRQLARCGKAIGEEDPSKIAAAVEAFIRSNKKD